MKNELNDLIDSCVEQNKLPREFAKGLKKFIQIMSDLPDVGDIPKDQINELKELHDAVCQDPNHIGH